MKKILLFCIPLFCLLGTTTALRAQSSPAELDRMIREKDSLFWTLYNRCDAAAMRPFFATNLEFYHDKGGITSGLEAFITSVQQNLCSRPGWRLRRAAVPNTVNVFPLAGNNQPYGALISGEHLFYETNGAAPERLVGRARFMHLWLLQNGEWKMTRIYSYDHGPAN
ncbi:MAG TPA: nuclear transport factor 2 family protein [Chitinophagaceae bacterium]|jgi:hypothetical protein|nr:nuclear transport factor 2 family protein [Chitinophagaceae bacterium]